MTDPYARIVGGASAQPFATGLEGFNVPAPESPQGPPRPPQSALSFPSVSSRTSGSSGSSGSSGGQSQADALQAFQLEAQLQKTLADYHAMVKQARFFLPKTLAQIGSQYGSQGSYYSSGRRTAQSEAVAKTKFDLGAAKRDAQYQMLVTQLELAQQQASRNG